MCTLKSIGSSVCFSRPASADSSSSWLVDDFVGVVVRDERQERTDGNHKSPSRSYPNNSHPATHLLAAPVAVLAALEVEVAHSLEEGEDVQRHVRRVGQVLLQEVRGHADHLGVFKVMEEKMRFE